MKNAVTRACAWMAVALLSYAPLTGAQSVETITGQARFVDIPGTTIGTQPSNLTVGPDGLVYFADANIRLMRINPATGSVTALPASPGGLNFPIGWTNGFAFDATGHLYSPFNQKLNRLNTETGAITPLGTFYYSGGAMAFAPDGKLYFAPGDNHVYLRLPSGEVSVIAGAEESGFSGDGGPALTAQMSFPQDMKMGPDGNLYIADTDNNRIRKINLSTGIITTVAGTGEYGFNGDGLPGPQTNISYPMAIAFDPAGNLYVGGIGDYRIRRIDAVTGLVSTFLGNGNPLMSGDDGPAANATVLVADGLAFGANGDLYFFDQTQYYHYIRKLDAATGIVSRLVGLEDRWFCGENVPAHYGCASDPHGLDVDDAGNLLWTQNQRWVRKVTASTNRVATIGESPAGAWMLGVGHDASGNVYWGNATVNQVFKVDAISGLRTVFAGIPSGGFSGDGGPATAARFSNPTKVVFDAANNAFIADPGNRRIRRIDANTGIVSTYAGNGNNIAAGDGGPATAASFYAPNDLWIDQAGDLIIRDGCSFRKIMAATGVINTVAGAAVCSFSYTGDGGPAIAARFPQFTASTIDLNGNIFLAWSGQLRRIDAATGIVTSVPQPTGGYVSPEGIVLRGPSNLAFDRAGRLYWSSSDANYTAYIFRLTGVADTTPPVVTPNISGTAGTNGWYRSTVAVSWTVSDPDSTIRSQSGCSNSSVSQDTAGVTFTCTATSDGGTTTRSVTIKRDTQAPSLTFGALSPAPDAAGWNSGDVTIPYATSDSLSGVYSTDSPNPLVVTGEGNGLGVPVVVTDFAGNSMTFRSPPVRIDRTPPSIIPTITGPLGNNGWYRGNVELTWSAPDGQSELHSYDCPSQTVTTDTAGVTFTCTATSAGGTATGSVTLKRDATPPTLTFGAALPAADDNGWRSVPVSVPYEAGDATSGVATTSVPSPLSLTTPGDAVTGQVVITDVAGNSATFTTDAYKIDASPPTITSFVYGTSGTNGWYRSDARVTFTVGDTDSGILSSDGCAESNVTSDTAGVTFTCTATSAGGTTTKSVTVKRDATPPTLTWGAPNPPPNAAGWNTTDVSFAFTTADATSGVGGTSHPSPAVVPFDGPGVSTPITVWDNAGNSVTVSTPPVNIDRSLPVVNFFVNGPVGNNGWYTGDVSVTWQIVKAPENILSQTGCVNTTVTADTAGTTFGCSVTSGAGTTSQTVTIKRDATPPTLSWGSFSPAPNTSGWNKTNVTVPFTYADATSGVASTSATSPLTIGTEGAGVTGQVTVTDNAGNSKVFSTAPRNIDKTGPVVALTAPANGVTYGFYQDVVADFACTDVSPVSCTGTNADGDLVNTKTAGARTFKVTAKDAVAFTTTVTNSFDVASVFNFEGFLPNLQTYPTNNLVPKGSLVPIRWRLPDGNGGYVSNTASFTSVAVTTTACSGVAPPLNDPASGPAGISFDPATNAFTYNWQTSTSWTGCRTLTVKFKDGSQRQLVFKLQ